MIKVLHILSDSNVGGAGTYVANLARYHDRDSFQMSVLLPRGSSVVKLLDGLDVEVIEGDIAPDKSLDLRSVSVIRKYIKSSGCDIIHAHGSASSRIAAKGICKSVFTKHTLSSGGNGLRGIADKILYRLTGGYAIAVSQAAKENLINLGFNKKRIFTVLNGVTDMEIPARDVKKAAKSSFGIDASKVVVGCVARFSPEKDYATLLKAAEIALSHSDRFAFLLCGDGKTLNDMKTLAKQLGIYSKCVFAGTVFDISRAYHAMDAYCITSLYESFGQSLVEAWSAGLPCITTNARGFAEISSDGLCSVMCPAGNAQAVADGILKIYNDKNAAEVLCKNGRARYEQLYDGKSFARNIESVYKTICRKQ